MDFAAAKRDSLSEFFMIESFFSECKFSHKGATLFPFLCCKQKDPIK